MSKGQLGHPIGTLTQGVERDKSKVEVLISGLEIQLNRLNDLTVRQQKSIDRAFGCYPVSPEKLESQGYPNGFSNDLAMLYERLDSLVSLALNNQSKLEEFI